MHLTTARNYIRRHPILTASSIMSLSLAFLAVLLFGISFYGSQVVIKYFESKAQISAYFKEEAQESDILALKKSLDQSGLTAKVEYVSKDAAKDFFLKQNKEHPEILEALDSGSNPFPASLEIEAVQISDLPQIATTVKNNPLVEEVSYREDVVNTLKSWTRGIRLAGVLLVGAFAGVAALVVLVTVGLTIFSKRDEIDTMLLLGAKPSFIKGPFLVQGGFYGLCGAAVSLGLLGGLGILGRGWVRGFLAGVPFPAVPWFGLVSLGLAWLVLGALTGVLVSALATARYLRK